MILMAADYPALMNIRMPKKIASSVIAVDAIVNAANSQMLGCFVRIAEERGIDIYDA